MNARLQRNNFLLNNAGIVGILSQAGIRILSKAAQLINRLLSGTPDTSDSQVFRSRRNLGETSNQSPPTRIGVKSTIKNFQTRIASSKMGWAECLCERMMITPHPIEWNGLKNVSQHLGDLNAGGGQKNDHDRREG